MPCCIACIFWNENNAVLDYAVANLVFNVHVAEGCIPDHSNNGRLILAACTTYAPNLALELPEVLKPFLPYFQGAEISWSPEIYQYIESSERTCAEDTHGDERCETKYTCSTGWSARNVDSSAFQCLAGQSNANHTLPSNLNGPGSRIAEERKVILSSPNRLYGFALDMNLQSQFPSVDLGERLEEWSGANIRWQGKGGVLLPQHLNLIGGYLTTSIGDPIVGDVRVSLSGKAAAQATVVAQQQFGFLVYDLGPYPSQTLGWFGKRTKPFEKLKPGILSKDEFFTPSDVDTSTQTHLIRILAILVTIIALEMIFQPLAVFAMGNALARAAQCVIHTLAVVMAMFVACVAIAIAWCVTRPVLAFGLLVIAAGLLIVVMWNARHKTAAMDVRAWRDNFQNHPFSGATPRTPMQYATPRTPMGQYSHTPRAYQMQAMTPRENVPGGTARAQSARSMHSTVAGENSLGLLPKVQSANRLSSKCSAPV